MKRLLVCAVPLLFLSAAPSLNYDNDNAIRFASQQDDNDGSVYLVRCRRDRLRIKLSTVAARGRGADFDLGAGRLRYGDLSVGEYGLGARGVCPSGICGREYGARSFAMPESSTTYCPPEYSVRTYSVPGTQSYSVQSIVPQQFS